MITYTPRLWYWLRDDGAVYSAPAQNVVTASDAGYVEFLAGGNKPTRWPVDNSGQQTLASLADVIGLYGLSTDPVSALIAYAATARYAREIGGTTVSGQAMPTDRTTQAQLTGAYAYAQANSGITVQWKMPDGSFVSLSAALIIAIAQGVAAHVQACFAEEATLVAAIKAAPPTVTGKAQIDAAFAAIA